MNIRSPRVARIALTFFILSTLIGSLSFEVSARGRHARGRAASRVARGGRLSRHERRQLARAGRRGGRVHLSKRELREDRRRQAREEAAYLAKLERRAGHKLSKRERAAEMRRFGSKHRREME